MNSLKNIFAVLLLLAATSATVLGAAEFGDASSPMSAAYPSDFTDASASSEDSEEEHNSDSNEDALIFAEQPFRAFRLLSHIITNDILPNTVSVHITPPPKSCMA
ncbi:MAG: hypothetical protein HY22_07790 [[Candidatus Thermochlorobacteriaceae] bacterium GBChlB]|nr:MAG: hypothetical protein HY22_07790 [[Candidatus Thermochlorobacteriaceae] bacterium GBChlB]